MPNTFDLVPARFGQLPKDRGVLFQCRHCRRPYAVARDVALREWGRRGVIAEACAALRCDHCKKRGMTAALAPLKAKLGSPGDLDRLTEQLRDLKAPFKIS